MPEDRFAKHQSERHFINQRFEGAETAIGLRKAGVRPRPEMPMAEAAVVALHAEAEGIAAENLVVEANLSGENSVGMRRAGKADPTFVAQGDGEIGAITQVPGEAVSAKFEGAAAGGVFDAVGAGCHKERATPVAEMQGFERELLDESLRLAATRRPRCPDLHRGCSREAGTAFASWIRQEIAQPPCARVVGQAEAQEPRFVAAARAEPRERQIQRSHIV